MPPITATPWHDDCRRLEQTLLALPAVADCAVLRRRNLLGRAELLAYVVPAASPSDDELREAVRSLELPVPPEFVQVSCIPRTAAGAPDAAQLSRLPVVDETLLQQLEAAAKSRTGIVSAAMLVEGGQSPALPLHLDDLLPEGPTNPQAAAPASTVSGAAAAPLSAGPSPWKAAIADGGPLARTPDAPRVLGDALDRAAMHSPHGLVWIEADGAEALESYRALRDRADRILGGLQGLGLTCGDRVVLQLERHQDFLETFWACVLGGIVPVPLAVPPGYDKPSAPLQTLHGAWETLRPALIVTSGRAAGELAAAVARTGIDGARVHAVEQLRASSAGRAHEAAPDDLALLMLTSGSTGAPKAVMLTHRSLLSRTAGSEQLNGFSQADVSLNWMPLDHVAGLIYFHIRDVYLGCRQVHVPTARVLQDPLAWIEYLDRYRATITFAPNFAFGLVNDRAGELAGRSWDLSCVRFVLNGAEAIVAATARRFLAVLERYGLDPASMHPAWGMSETSSGVIYGDRFSLATTSDDDPLVEVGRPIPGVAARIVDGDGHVVGEGEVGRLQVRGAVVTAGYFGNAALTREVFTPDAWFETGDLGSIRDGRLTITGREKDVVIVNSVNYHCHAIEAAVERVDGVETSYTAACAVRLRGANTDRLAIFFHPSDPDSGQLPDLLARIRAEVTTRIGIAPDYLLPVDRAAIPKTSLGKIQRSALGRRFGAGEFDEQAKQVDRLTAAANTIPDWFFRKAWRRSGGAPERTRLNDGTAALVFGRDDELCESVRNELRALGVRTCVVAQGGGFAGNVADGFRIDPRSESDYGRLIRALAEAGLTPTHIVHLWGWGAYAGEAVGSAIEEAQLWGLLSALWLAKALAGMRPVHPAFLLVAASHVQRVNAGDPVAYEKAPVLGLIKTLPQELEWLRCRHVDLPAGDPASTAAAILDELSISKPDREVAYRDGQRFVAGLDKVVFRPGGRIGPVLQAGAMLLVTGGAGGVAEPLLAFLIERFGAKLLLIGRGVLDARRQATLQRLQRSGGTLAYESADVCDERRLNDLVEEYKTRWGCRLGGVIHLAGLYHESLVLEETADRLLASMRPKTLGTGALHRLLAAQGGGVLVSWSSIAGFFGGATIGAYAAANCFQAAFADHFADRGAVAHYCFGWSNWDGVGQSRGRQLADSPRARGYQAIATHQGLQSMLVGLAFGERALLVGLDGGHQRVRRYLGGAPALIEPPVLYYATNSCYATTTAAAPPELDVRDRFGTPCPADLVRVSAMPITGAGEIDRDALARIAASRGRRSPVNPPETECERRVAEIWTRLLAAAAVSRDDNFFELGGDSLLAVRLVAQLRDAFGCDVSLRTVFDAAALSELAAAIERLLTAPSAPPEPATAAPTAAPLDARALLAQLDDLDEHEVDALLDRLADMRTE